MTNNQITYFEVASPSRGGYNRFKELEDARKELADMRAGYPNNDHMSDENREYWKKAGKDTTVFEVNETKIITEIK